MSRYSWKKKTRKIGAYAYRIRRIYRPSGSTFDFRLERKECGFFANDWEFVATTPNFSDAQKWSDDMGLEINPQPDSIRKPLI